MNKKVFYQGIEGSFSYLAAQKALGKRFFFVGLDNFEKVFKNVIKEEGSLGVIPIENSIAGSIYENYDNLEKFSKQIQIVKEIYLNISHYLLGIKSKIPKRKRLKLIKKVYSHPKALEQCNKFFEKYPHIEKVAFTDTAGAAKFVSEMKDLTLGAIASKETAKIYKLQVLKEKIEDNYNNFTRFFIISKKTSRVSLAGTNKCSLIFKLPHLPGTLYQALEIFATCGINLTKIESRPIIGRPFEYNFFLDFEFKKKHLKMMDMILREIKQKTLSFTILGFYKKGKWEKK